MVKAAVTEEQIAAYIAAGGQITKLPDIEKPKDRTRLNAKRHRKKPEKPATPEPITPARCQQCQQENGPSDRRCLSCQHYRQWSIEHDLKETIAFDHVPQAIIEAVADMPAGLDIIDKIRRLPLHRSVPLIMQYVLNATDQEIGNYHKITRQAVARKNKLTIKILRTSIRK